MFTWHLPDLQTIILPSPDPYTDNGKWFKVSRHFCRWKKVWVGRNRPRHLKLVLKLAQRCQCYQTKRKVFQDKLTFLCQAIYWTKICTFMIIAFKWSATSFKEQKFFFKIYHLEKAFKQQDWQKSLNICKTQWIIAMRFITTAAHPYSHPAPLALMIDKFSQISKSIIFHSQCLIDPPVFIDAIASLLCTQNTVQVWCEYEV